MTDQNFDKWNEIKKRLQKNVKVRYFRERQVWWCSVGQNIGSETFGKGETFTRPVIIFRKFSRELFLGIPLTSKDKSGSWYHGFSHKGKKTTAMLHQIRVMDKKRLIDRFGELDDSDFSKISEALINLYFPKNIRPTLRRGSMGKSQK